MLYIAILTDGKRNSFPIIARSMRGLLTEIRKECTFPWASDVQELASNVEFYYGSDILFGKMSDGSLKQIGALFHRESISE